MLALLTETLTNPQPQHLHSNFVVCEAHLNGFTTLDPNFHWPSWVMVRDLQPHPRHELAAKGQETLRKIRHCCGAVSDPVVHGQDAHCRQFFF